MTDVILIYMSFSLLNNSNYDYTIHNCEWQATNLRVIQPSQFGSLLNDMASKMKKKIKDDPHRIHLNILKTT